MLELPLLTLVTGGAASGKSAFGERLVVASGRPRVYLATARVHDHEMGEKVANHVRTRGANWRTIEGSVDALAGCDASEVVLLDCATMFLTNALMDEVDLNAATDNLLFCLSNSPCPVVIVSNELGQGVVPDTALARRFRNAHGVMNQRLAAQAAWAFGVMAGLPLTLKGPNASGLF